ncbi:uncharacterized protein LOC125681767 isoform X2 [Ostrea edulis]|uniref:uncharacterized protein LOC125681767 isoform X2 n=1 Tax=Ostrea edulis TaxID=37623 RepID=UPI0020950C63|nr:uncharacterized protein LOC125681767 isoform X2 [Ostrea edulis]
MQTCLLLLSALAYLVSADECVGKNNGVFEIGCRAYVVCHNQHGTIHHCADPPALNTVYNSRTKSCDQPHNVPAPCGSWRDCSTLPDKRYADVTTNCTSYYTCQGGTYFGHNFCNPGVVFDENMQICNWPGNVAPPCGTAGTGR